MELGGSTRMLQEFDKRVISPTSKWDILGFFHPLILTLDPNFQWNIQVVNQAPDTNVVSPKQQGFNSRETNG